MTRMLSVGALALAVSGLLIAASLFVLSALFRGYGAWASTAFIFGPWWENASWFSIPLVAFGICYALYYGVFGQLFLVSLGERLLGRWLAQDVHDPDGGFAVSLWDTLEDMQAYEQSNAYREMYLPSLRLFFSGEYTTYRCEVKYSQ